MKRLWFTLALTTLALQAGGAFGQPYPSKPIRIVVPFVAGGAVDALARMVGAKLSESLGQPVIVENRPGAGGNVAADAVAKSPPDGYTILQNTNGQAISPSIYRSLPFDVVRDFIPVTQLVASHAGGKPEAWGHLGPGTDRAREGQAQQSQLRHDRCRQSAPPDHGDVQDRGRHRHPGGPV
jgi:hypothetical protein